MLRRNGGAVIAAPVGRLIAAAGLILALGTAPVRAADWAEIMAPASGPAEAIGSAAAGCLRGAVALPPEGPGYQVLRPGRHRAWGHPLTVAFVQHLAADFQAGGDGMGLLIGDMAQPRGGPLPFGHASHQSGLDVDIWFRLAAAPLTAAQLAAPEPVSMVRGQSISPAAWGAAQVRLLQLAATAPGVDRIFVHPAIKRALCRTAPPEQRGWLARLRPWWGHTEHFHVRLACPADSPACLPQTLPPPGDGCDQELESWLSRPLPPPREHAHVQARPLPEACAALRDE